MTEPSATRPHMPGYGTAPAGDGTGLLPWSWAETRLRDSHDYWVATVTPGGRPHLMPVWAAWTGDALWFSSSLRSAKARNVAAGSAVSVSTDDPYEPVVLEGPAEIVTDLGALRTFLDAVNGKYKTTYGMDMLDPASNASIRVRPRKVFGMLEKDFSGSPTRWVFPA
ncbi:pyridoxamine 5'-phosphate oxidase [Amycolatopsis sp. WAC 01375]|uniref:pyridoxamine 5'-phosphate oxidase family protein n=1 Tax=unclassified Amycolatopsis TaxID=2618356 RepID=UPI000F780B35|nr:MULTISPECIES: pyridoxamine 5'-phosphate oxidase family protein [unclassified Amycolatopsis]RSM83704.1 pyridoxamine 5'-phosphate oxidase [Amycolatopsis sp. WAC 01375]RSN34077.1 pyridoxamine 5'-phosphate oxidase [Amycolatopsis sp. WAC 01416]